MISRLAVGATDAAEARHPPTPSGVGRFRANANLLFERRLGIGVDAVGQVEDLCAVLFQGRGQALLGLGERLCRAGGGKRDGH